MLIKTEENNLKLDDDFGKLQNWVYVWLKHDGKEDSINADDCWLEAAQRKKCG
jgi:hypothetical protein